MAAYDPSVAVGWRRNRCRASRFRQKALLQLAEDSNLEQIQAGIDVRREAAKLPAQAFSSSLQALHELCRTIRAQLDALINEHEATEKAANSLHLWLFLVAIRIYVTERPVSSLFTSSRPRSPLSPPTLTTELSDENPAMAGAALRF